jgi:TonB family protein
MKRFIYCFLLFLPAFCRAQTDTVYFSKDWGKCAKDVAHYYRVVGPQTDSGYRVTDRYKSNNQVQMLGYSLQKDSDVNNGHCIYYNENGTISSEGDFKAGKRNGHFTYYKENGNLSEEGDYKNEKQSGYWIHYFEDTNVVWWTCSYNEGKLDRKLLSYYRSGKLKRLTHYNNGELLSGKCYAEDGSEIPFTEFEVWPQFPEYVSFIQRYLKYPDYARSHNIEGQVVVKFVVNEKGEIEDPRIIKSVHKTVDAAALDVVKQMPRWKPGMIDDKPAKIWFTLPINFHLR